MLCRLRLAVEQFAVERGEPDRGKVVVEGGALNLLADRDEAVEFLIDLASKCFARALAWLDLAARELPFQRQVAPGTTLRAEDLPSLKMTAPTTSMCFFTRVSLESPRSLGRRVCVLCDASN